MEACAEDDERGGRPPLASAAYGIQDAFTDYGLKWRELQMNRLIILKQMVRPADNALYIFYQDC